MTIRPAGICTHRTTPKPRWQWVTVLLLLLSLLGGSAPANGQESGPLSAPKPLDVILLIDSSPSTRETDRSGWRISASRFLLDYLQATSQVLRVNYRAGVANFGGRMGAASGCTCSKLAASDWAKRSGIRASYNDDNEMFFPNR